MEAIYSPAGAHLTVRHQQILNYWSAQLKNMPLEISWRWKWEIQKVEMRNTSRKSWENEMRIGRVTKWGLGGWHECPATAALGEVWKFTLVSEHAEIRMNSKSTHSAPSIAKWLSWKPSKSNLPVLRVLETQPTSSSKWVGEPDYPQTWYLW